jgi:hypothetical protein
MRLHSARQLLVRQIFRICSNSEFTWRYVANLGPSVTWRKTAKPLRERSESLLQLLRTSGMAVTSVSDFLPDAALFEELASEVARCETEMAREIEQRRAALADGRGNKRYLVKLLGSFPELNPHDIFVRFALQPEIVELANGYFGMYTRLRYYNVWHTLPSSSPPRESQLWHRDPEDRAVFKVFVYLSDVDEGAGALTYASGTHGQGSVKIEPPSNRFREGGVRVRRSTDAQMETVVPRARWKTVAGPRGTIAFVDTRGYHKGGYARTHDRIVYTCMFTSRASISPEVFRRAAPVSAEGERWRAYALGL